jgi:hypothetical protein
MTTTMVSPLVQKELRALAPVFFGCATFVIACSSSGIDVATPIGVLGYLVGTTSLGALAIGQEFSHGMLDQMLAQPTARQRLLRRKLWVLALYLIALAAVAMLALPFITETPIASGSAFDRALWRAMIVLPPALLAFGVAPWLSVTCRSPLASAVFTLAIYALLWMLGDYVSPWIGTGDAHPSTVAPGVVAVAAAASVAGWRSFMRIEAAGRPTGVAHLLIPRRAHQGTASATTTGHPLRALVVKELRLQQMAWIIAALFVATWAVVNGVAPQAAPIFGYITLLCRAFVAILIGAVASAEERALGTLSLQNVQPCSVRRQWAVKVSMALTLTLLLACAIPSLLETVRSSAAGTTWLGVKLLTFGSSFSYTVLYNPFGMSFALCVIALYVSSACRTTLSALLASLPVAATLLGAAGVVSINASRIASSQLRLADLVVRFGRWAQTQPLMPWKGGVDLANSNWWWLHQIEILIAIHAALMILLLVLLLVLAFRNHRSALIEPRVLARQAAWIVASVLLFATMSGATAPVLSWTLINALMSR